MVVVAAAKSELFWYLLLTGLTFASLGGCDFDVVVFALELD